MNKLAQYQEFEQYYTIRVLVHLGFSNRAIMRETGLEKGELNYRIKKLGLAGVRKEWRDGTSKDSRKLISLGLTKQDVKLLRLHD